MIALKNNRSTDCQNDLANLSIGFESTMCFDDLFQFEDFAYLRLQSSIGKSWKQECFRLFDRFRILW